VIITSDHGEEFGDHGGLLHRGLLYDELLHVPLIIAGNLVPKGKVINYMVNCVDIMPTILAISGIEIKIPVEGKNLFSRNYRSKDQEDIIFAQRGISRYAARTQEWKFIEYHQPDKIELFNLSSDPQEQKNVSDNYPKIRDKFIRVLSEWRESRLKLDELRTHKIEYSEETLDKLQSLGYVE
jgi:arylsulfatase A-like enzyme